MEAEAQNAGWRTWERFSPPLGECQVAVYLDRKRFNAAQLPAKLLERADAIWAELVRRQPRLFAALKFRLASVETRKDGGAFLGIGITDYKSFLTTNRAEDQEFLAALPLPMEAYLANSCGCGVVVLTRDNNIVFHRRSFHVAEFRGWWDCPGGHPEPSKAGIGLIKVGDDENENERAKKELFQSALDEVHDEVNIPYENMSAPLLLGIVQHAASRFRPCAMFVVRTNLSSAEVGEAFTVGGKEADESTSLALFHLDVVRKGTGPVTLVALPPRPPNSSPAAAIDQPTCFEDLDNSLVCQPDQIKCTLVPSALFVADYIRTFPQQLASLG